MISSYFLNALFDQQILKTISQVEPFLYQDKQRTPEEGWRIQWPKRYVTTNNNKNEDNSPKNHTEKFFFFLFN